MTLYQTQKNLVFLRVKHKKSKINYKFKGFKNKKFNFNIVLMFLIIYFMMMSFLKNKVAKNVTTLTVSICVYKVRNYSYDHTKKLIENINVAHAEGDKARIYCSWVVCATNFNGLIPNPNYDVLSKMAKRYNQRFSENSTEKLTEQECLGFWGIEYSDSSLSKDFRLPYVNFSETLAIEHINKSNLGFTLVRNYNNNLRIPNLGLQPNNDCIGVIFKKNGVPQMFYIDIKNTTMDVAMKKLKLTNMQDKSMFRIEGSGQKFGCNVYVIATSESKDLVLSINERNEMMSYLERMIVKHPQVYEGLKQSQGYTEFCSTGNWEDLNNSGYPVPVVVRPQKLVSEEILEKLKNSEEYKKLIHEIPMEEIIENKIKNDG